MILKAKYTGPFPEVTVPGFASKTATPGEEVTIRVPDGFPIGGCWEITEGLKEYRAALEKAEKALVEKHKARAKRAEKLVDEITSPDETEHYLASGEADHTNKKATKSAKSGGAK